jgi:hypothetical protein
MKGLWRILPVLGLGAVMALLVAILVYDFFVMVLVLHHFGNALVDAIILFMVLVIAAIIWQAGKSER